MSKRFDELFREIVEILRQDWAGAPLAGELLDPRYYNQAVGQAWHDGKLDELLFLRYINQMLACTGDRHLRFTMRPDRDYKPWSCGFFTRRYEDSLYVTALRCETRLEPGDRITAVNGGSPSHHRAHIQKNFFYAADPEREDWNGFLKMADTIDVEHMDGSAEQLTLKRWPLHPVFPRLSVHEMPGGLIVDLRNLPDLTEAELDGLLPRFCRRDTPLRELTETDLSVNYTRRNCIIRAAGLQGAEGLEPFLAELREKSGRGFLPESADEGEIIPGRAREPVVVLTDTWTRDGAETAALAAKRAGCVLIGRPTLGTLDLCGDVSYELDERYVLTWPTAVTRAALEGRGTLGRGIEPDIYIPWTPEECFTDVIMARALAYLRGK